MNLGDFFNDEIRKEYAERQIDIGKALLIKIPDFNVNYPKYCVVVALNNYNIAGVIINTEINSNIFKTDDLRKLHLPILQRDHPFLKYDSFVDCSQLIKWKIEYIIEVISKKPEIVVGNVTDDLLKKIHLTITFADTITSKEKKNFGFL